MKKTFTTQFNRSASQIRDVNCVKFTAPEKVKKSLAYAVDINTIYNQYTKTGKLPLNGAQPIYDENFIKFDSLIEAQKLCDEASKYFSTLPANIKNNYGNSLSEFIKALNNKDEFLIKEGLLQLPVKDSVIDDIKTDDTIPSVQPQIVQTVNTEAVNTVTTD